MGDVCQRALDVFGVSVEWVLGVVVLVFGDGWCWRPRLQWSSEASWKWSEGGGSGVEKMICGMVTVDEMQFSFMPERGTVDVVFVLGLQWERSCLCVLCTWRGLWWSAGEGVEWAVGKKEVLVLVGLEMDLCGVVKTGVGVDSEMLEEVGVGMCGVVETGVGVDSEML